MSPISPLIASAASPIRLRCLAGGAMPDELARDAQRLEKVNDAAIAALAPLLRPLVLDSVTPELGAELSRLCVRHEIAEADLGHVIRAVRWLLREAAGTDLDRAGLESDVQSMWRAPGALAEVVLDAYGPIKEELRRRLFQDALTQHGNVLVDVDWRVDFVAEGRHAPKLMSPVALVTLSYRGADGAGRLTLQLVPEQLAKLQQIFAALGQKTTRPPE